jgi:phenylalanyl-tRNA synthetase alpha chain
MSDLAAMEAELLAAVEGAPDLAGLDAVRVGALGKSGSVSALLKTLGQLPPDERRTRGPEINGLRDRVAAAVAARRETLEAARSTPASPPSGWT